MDLSGQPPQSAPTSTPVLSTPTPVPTATSPPAPTATPFAVAAAPTATPQIAAFPPKPTSEPQARGGIRGGGICPGVAALPLAVASLAWTCRRKTGCNLTDGKPLDFSADKG